MDKQSNLSQLQIAIMAAGSAIMFPYTFLSILRTTPANQDVWVVMFLSIVYILILNAPLLFIANKYRGLNLVQINEVIFGNIMSKVINIIFMLFSIFCFVACMILSALFVNIYILQNTPIWVILILIIFPLSYASIKGPGVMGRLAMIIMPLIIISLVIFMFMGLKEMDFKEILPIMSDSTLIDINKGAFLNASRFSEIVIILFFSFYLSRDKSINKTFGISLLIFGIAYSMIVLPVLLVLGHDFAYISNNPYFTYTRQVGGADFAERVQALDVMTWFMGTIIKLMIYNFMASSILRGVVKKGKHLYYVIGISIFAFIICLLPITNKLSNIHILKSDAVFPWIVLSVIFVLPLIMIIIHQVRRKTIKITIEQVKSSNETKSLVEENGTDK